MMQPKFKDVTRAYLFALGKKNKLDEMATSYVRSLTFNGAHSITIDFLHNEENTVENLIKSRVFQLSLLTTTGKICKTFDIYVTNLGTVHPKKVAHDLIGMVILTTKIECNIF